MMAQLLAHLLEWLRAIFAAPAESEQEPQQAPASLAWGLRVSTAFRKKAFEIGSKLGVEPAHLMACMAFETGGTFDPAEKNRAGSGATGLIQFMPATARGLGTTTDALAQMSAVEQLDYVYMYFLPYAGRLRTLSDVYMAILWPRAIGKPEDYVLWSKANAPTTYRQNSGLDRNGDYAITKAEAAHFVQAALENGCRPENLWVGRAS